MNEPRPELHEPHAPDVADALDNLVRQFADPLAFLRELVQNALDAGSNEVEVAVRFKPSAEDPERGLATIAVDDFGEGMDRQIIDTKLTRLFSSAKDKDFTKIGKFGIGFVSVFALQPDAVVVDTARGGEAWRVIFKSDRSFVRVARDTPVDGTKIQVIKAMTRAECAELRQRAHHTLRFWCKHVASPILFEGEPINLPFELADAVCTVRRSLEGIEVVAGYLAGLEPTFGFYNKGLTLMEGRGGFFERAAFKVSSKFLEHTLSRDNVMRDAHFDKVVTVARELVERELDAALYARLGEHVRAGDAPAVDGCARVAATLLAAGRSLPREALELALARDLGGEPRTLGALRKALEDGRLFLATGRSSLTDALVARSMTLIPPPSEGVGHLLSALGGGRSPRPVEHAWVLPADAGDAATSARWQPLAAAVEALLRERGVRVAALRLAHFAAPGHAPHQRIYLVQRSFGEPSPWDQDAVRPIRAWGRRDTIVVNADHESVAPLLALCRSEPEFAAYTLVKLLHLQGGPITVEEDGELARLATAQREARRGAKS